MMVLLDACPEDRYLVHGGYGYGNVLAREGAVTAVLDWFDAMYGDFAYDIAVAGFWVGPEPIERYRRYYKEHGMDLENFRERIACSQCYIGLDALKFFAKAGKREAYDMACGVVGRVMADCP